MKVMKATFVQRSVDNTYVHLLLLQIFKGKTGVQLEALKSQIESKISGRRDGVDVGYWESLLSQLKGKSTDNYQIVVLSIIHKC